MRRETEICICNHCSEEYGKSDITKDLCLNCYQALQFEMGMMECD